jgi:hypothetical protein
MRQETGDRRQETRETRDERRETRERESERIKVRAIIFLNRPGQNEKSANFRGKSGIVCPGP